MSTESWLVGPQSTNFYTRHYRAASPKAAIVFVHGFAEHCSRYIEIHTQLADNGVSVFTYDQRGYGNTALDVAERSKGSAYGKTNWEHQMEDLNWAVEFAKKEYPGLPVYIMGQSMVRCSLIRLAVLSSSRLGRRRGFRVRDGEKVRIHGCFSCWRDCDESYGSTNDPCQWLSA